MAGSIEQTGPGTQVVDTLVDHEARSAARRLITGVFDAWDRGDGAAFVEHFAPSGAWADPSGERSVGHVAIAEHFARWRGWEPFSVHWASNEQVLAEDGFVSGTWLWSAASNIDGGETAAWSGGDLDVVFAVTDDGWRISSLAVTDRYRTPYHAGWLDHLLVEPALGRRGAAPAGVVGIALRGVDLIPPPAPVVGSDEERSAALSGESEVRWLLGEYSDAVEQEAPGTELVQFWTADGTYSTEVVDAPAIGVAAVALALDAEAERASAWIRALMSQSIVVSGDTARCRWRDIWTAEVDGEARWLAHGYDATVVATPDGWRIAQLERTRLLDCSYQEGWTPETVKEAAR